MSRFPVLFVALGLLVTLSQASMDCTLGTSENFVDKIINSCPSMPFSNKEYCCYNLHGSYCCDAEEFALTTGLGIIIPAIIAVVVIVSLIVCCISCLCCTCCPWYRRRHRGTVYGNLQTPSTMVHVIQTPAGYTGQPVQNQHTAYAADPTGLPEQPPQYTTEGYTKQAPYNPNYLG